MLSPETAQGKTPGLQAIEKATPAVRKNVEILPKGQKRRTA